MKVKVCGITNLADAEHAVSLGADAIGFIFTRSPRRISSKKAAAISRVLGPWVTTVGVFVDEKPQNIRRIARECRLGVIQLHGNESSADAKTLQPLKVIKVFGVDANFEPNALKPFSGVDAFLFDTKINGRSGGTGKTFDWNQFDTKKIRKPVIISGGLNAGNVRAAIKRFKPYGVDVSSGVEKTPGKKDLRLLKEFMENAKG